MHYSFYSLLSKVAKHWIPLCISMLVIISFVSLRPMDLDLKHHSDKLGHLIVYSALIFPVALKNPRYFIWVFMIFSLWSGIIEILQSHIGRQGDWLDWLANNAGLTIGSLIAFCLTKFFLSKPSLTKP